MTPLDPTAYDDFDESEWRKRPRRDRTGKRDHRIAIRVTGPEYEQIAALAAGCEMPIGDYIVCRLLRRSVRVDLENDLTQR